MQIIVLGMHRSGTSTVARLLNLSGAYFGPRSIATPTTSQNPKGFWERKDMRALCDAVLHAMEIDWWFPSALDFDRIPDERRAELVEQARRLFATQLEPHAPYFVKEPRLCLVFPLLRPLFDQPVIVNVIRDPLEVARSLRTRNGFSLPMGLALWEFYQTHALEAARDLPTVTVRYADVLAAPVRETRRMCDQINRLGLGELKQPADEAVLDFVEPSLHRSKSDAHESEAFLTRGQQALLSRREDDPIPAVSDALREILAGCEERERVLLAERDRAKVARAKLTAHQHRLEAERRGLQRLDAQLVAARREVREMNALRAALEEQALTANLELERLQRALATSEKHRKTLSEQTSSVQRELERATESLRRLEDVPLVAALAAAERGLRGLTGLARGLARQR